MDTKVDARLDSAMNHALTAVDGEYGPSSPNPEQSNRRRRTGQTDPGDILVALLHRVGKGQQRAFGELYDLTAPRVFGLARTVLRDTSHAEEVTQEVFLQIWFTATTFDSGKGSALSWILQRAHSRAVDRVRQVQATRIRDSSYARLEYQPATDTALEAVLRDHDHQQLHTAMSMLTPLQRQALTLTYFDGHTYLVASEILGVPVTTLKSRIRSALIAMRAPCHAAAAGQSA